MAIAGLWAGTVPGLVSGRDSPRRLLRRPRRPGPLPPRPLAGLVLDRQPRPPDHAPRDGHDRAVGLSLALRPEVTVRLSVSAPDPGRRHRSACHRPPRPRRSSLGGALAVCEGRAGPRIGRTRSHVPRNETRVAWISVGKLMTGQWPWSRSMPLLRYFEEWCSASGRVTRSAGGEYFALSVVRASA